MDPKLGWPKSGLKVQEWISHHLHHRDSTKQGLNSKEDALVGQHN
jgi:hypothetical protein